MKLFLDTHVVVRLAEDDREAFGPRALDLLERSALLYAPVVRLELAMLHEIGRLKASPAAITGRVRERFGVVESTESAGDVMSIAEQLDWTRDPFDRLIAATAELHRAPLLTADATLRAHCARAVWG